MPRLTAELVAGSPQFMNPLKERELDLRGNSIPAIENLGAARVRCNPCAHVAARSVFLTHLFRTRAHVLTSSSRINLTALILLTTRFGAWKTFLACLA